jgi:hypothetical protein
MRLCGGRLRRSKELPYNNSMNCGCGNLIEPARLEIGFKSCKACAFTGPDLPKPKGVMIYSHKTSGEIEIHSAESWKEKRKYYVPNGARSAVKNFSKHVCS